MTVLTALVYYPSLAYNLLRHYAQPSSWAWYNRINGNLIVGALPFKSMAQELVQTESVGGVVCCVEDIELQATYMSMDESEWQKHSVRFHHLPMTDFTGAPSIEQLNEAVAFVRDVQSSGQSVYVHCKAGRTRSATIAAAVLMTADDSLQPSSAVAEIQRHRPQVHLRGSQQRALEGYRAELDKRKTAVSS